MSEPSESEMFSGILHFSCRIDLTNLQRKLGVERVDFSFKLTTIYRSSLNNYLRAFRRLNNLKIQRISHCNFNSHDNNKQLLFIEGKGKKIKNK